MQPSNHSRFFGEFYTPIIFARKSFEYIESLLGFDFLSSGNYRIWDMAAGRGNLEMHIPQKYHKHIYLSTIEEDDVLYCQKKFKQAICFQYDYLNDDVQNLFNQNETNQIYKMPRSLLDDLENKNINWLIFVNPPYATSQIAGTNSKSKRNVSKTNIRNIMHDMNMGEVSRELYLQFLFRIKYEFQNRIASLALFSKINFLVANNNQKFRDSICNLEFKNGFMFSSSNFVGTSKTSPFPVAFTLFKLHQSESLNKQNINLDLIDENLNIISSKKIYVVNRDRFLNKWIARPKCDIIFPPLSSAIKIKEIGSDIRNRISDGFIGSLMCCGNDLQKRNMTAILSAPQASAGALSITKNTFEKAMTVHAVRRIVKVDWTNSSDQFLKPSIEPENEFINDCIIWSLFSNSNQTVSMRDVMYMENIYQIINHFFPFTINDILKWGLQDNKVLDTIKNDEDRFVAMHLKNIKLSNNAMLVFDAALKIYKQYFQYISKLNQTKFDSLKIKWWDAGWWQIKKILQSNPDFKINFLALKKHQETLSLKILAEIYKYKFVL